jgi:NADH:ubiquinone reductase (H+-translocating)
MSKILILGGGFGGVRTALDLEKYFNGTAEITLIDRNPYHLFVPALYEVASAFDIKKDEFEVELKRTVAIPYSQIFEGKKISFVQGEVAKVSFEHQLVSTKGEHIFPYDYIVLSLGSQIADFGIPGVMEYACQFKNISDALMLRNKIESFFRKNSESNQPKVLKVVVGGAGFSGIELASELASYCHKMAERLGLKSRSFIIYLLEAGPKIMPIISEKERDLIRKRLTKLGVVVMENSPIESVHADSVKLKNGSTLDCDIVAWTAGIKANEFLASINNLPLTDRGKIIVGEHLHLDNFKNVFAVGDNIEFIDHKTQKPIPSLAYLAIDHGKVAAKNIYNMVKDKELIVHKPFYDSWVAPVGGKWAVAHLGGGRSVSGLLAWIIREIIDLRYFISILSFKKALRLFWDDLKIFTRND